MPPLVAIVGRPNVGKSTLFNRLLRQNKAITHDTPGVTRDRLYGQVKWLDVPFELVDTGGIVFEGEPIESSIFTQAREAVEAAELVLFTVDGREGLTPLDQDVAKYLRQSSKPVLVVVNKVDGPELEDTLTTEFHALGFPLFAVSSAHGYGIPDLGAWIASHLPPIVDSDDLPEKEGLRLAMIGRPNVGKSSIVNAMLGQERMIVSPVAGTTRDSVDVILERDGKKYVFLDTAGVRRRSKITDTLERFSVLKSLQSSKRAQIVILVLDAVQGLVFQDQKILSFLDKEKLPLIVVVNKIDLIPRRDLEALKRTMREALGYMPHVPVIYTSTVNRAGLGGLLPMAEKLWDQCQIRIGTGELNRFLQQATSRHQPPTVKRRRAKFYYVTQPKAAPPTFLFFVNDTALIKPSYTRYLENQIRKSFNLQLAPLRVVYRSSHAKK
ncbi:MAG: ribosome biogenesis GTPase Der [Desulfovibrionales bacterium]